MHIKNNVVCKRLAGAVHYNKHCLWYYKPVAILKGQKHDRHIRWISECWSFHKPALLSNPKKKIEGSLIIWLESQITRGGMSLYDVYAVLHFRALCLSYFSLATQPGITRQDNKGTKQHTYLFRLCLERILLPIGRFIRVLGRLYVGGAALLSFIYRRIR